MTVTMIHQVLGKNSLLQSWVITQFALISIFGFIFRLKSHTMANIESLRPNTSATNQSFLPKLTKRV